MHMCVYFKNLLSYTFMLVDHVFSRRNKFRQVKAFADDNINVTEKLKVVLGKGRKNVEKGKMLVTTIFSFFNNVLATLSGWLKVGTVW